MVDERQKRELMTALNFTQADLEANRNGALTEVQRENLTRWAGRMRLFSYIAFGVMAAVVGLGGLFVMTQIGQSMPGGAASQPEPFILIGVTAAVVILGVSFFVLRSLRQSSELASGKISVAEGSTKRQIKVQGGRTRLTLYTVTVGRIKFHVTKDQYDAFTEGAAYRVYYVKNPPAHIILSVE